MIIEDCSVTADALLSCLHPNAEGLVAAIAQDVNTGQVLMLAWMNKDALVATLQSGEVTYYSRSRQVLWRKGEQSGNFQQLCSVAVDCDGDALLLQVEQTGAACHTGAKSCFYRRYVSGGDKSR